MEKLFLQPTELGQWHALISEAECKSNRMLDDTVKGYLSQLLIKFTDDARLAQSVLALDFIEASQSIGEQQGQICGRESRPGAVRWQYRYPPARQCAAARPGPVRPPCASAPAPARPARSALQCRQAVCRA